MTVARPIPDAAPVMKATFPDNNVFEIIQFAPFSFLFSYSTVL